MMSVADAFVWACELDVAARKPGNVSHVSPGHGMEAQQFLASAAAAAGPLAEPGCRVGERIERAVRASLAAAGCNTNLGIVLLCAPLAAACERWRGGNGKREDEGLTEGNRDGAGPGDGASALRDALAAVLRGLDIDDARATYRAIALARPGGLGTVPEHDVAQPPRIGLVEAMALAAPRDRIAWQYTQDHADLFERGLPAFEAALGANAKPLDTTRAMQRVYLEFLATLPDSHIVRKRGDAAAHCVMAEAVPWRERVRRGDSPDADPAFAAWDASLKARALNPGTTADLAVATAFLAAVCSPRTRRLAAPVREGLSAAIPGVNPDRSGHGT